MRAITIRGSARTIQRLVDLSKQALREGAYRVATRLHAVVLNMEGRPAPEVAHTLKVHRSKVSVWLRNWQREGVDGRLEGHRPGRPPELSPRQRQALADIVDSGPVAYGFTSGVWTCPLVARVIEEEFSVASPPAHVSRILHALEFSVQRPRKTLARADQTLQSRWVRYRYPRIKKERAAKGPPCSSKTKPPSGRIPPSTKPGAGSARSRKSRPPASARASRSSASSNSTPRGSATIFRRSSTPTPIWRTWNGFCPATSPARSTSSRTTPPTTKTGPSGPGSPTTANTSKSTICPPTPPSSTPWRESGTIRGCMGLTTGTSAPWTNCAQR